MTTELETTETQVSEVQKTDKDTSVTSILAQLVKAQESRIDSFEKRFDGLETLIKEQNKNPVDQGVEDDTQAPAVSSPNDVGDPDKLGNTYAPSPKDQASIVPPQKGESPKTDAPSLTMGKADDDEDKKEDDKKADVEKTEDEDDKKEDVKKSESSEYEIVKTVRPLLKSRGEETTTPTGYQILKAISSGWNGQTSSAEDALVIAYNKLESGEFGNGLPGGY